MKLALALFYIIGGLLYYYYRTGPDIKTADKIEEQDLALQNYMKLYSEYPCLFRVMMITLSVLWPIALTVSFTMLISSIIRDLIRGD